MTTLLLALFAGAAILAVASMMATAKHYGAAVLAIARELGGCSEVPDPAQRKHLVYARRLKQPARKARARARRTRRGLGHDARIAAKPGLAVRKSVHNQYSEFRMALLSDGLALE